MVCLEYPERVQVLIQFSSETHFLNCEFRTDHVLFQVLRIAKTCQDLLKAFQSKLSLGQDRASLESSVG